jgi:hypothetical protein
MAGIPSIKAAHQAPAWAVHARRVFTQALPNPQQGGSLLCFETPC